MATYVIVGYRYTDFQGQVPAPGALIRLDPDFSASTDAYTFTVTDDDAVFNGAVAGPLDASQTVVVTNALGATVASGNVRLGYRAVLTEPGGTSVVVYEVYVNGTPVGVVSETPLEPGKTYQIATWTSTTSGLEPAYSALADATYEQGDANSLVGGDYGDVLNGGTGNDTIEGLAGADSITGGDGDDLILYGDGGASSLAGDTVYGGEGNDTIDDEAGVVGGNFNDRLFGEGGDDVIFAGDGNDYVDGGTGADSLIGEGGNDEILGGTGDDTIEGNSGADTLRGNGDADLIYGDGDADDIGGGDGDDTIYGGTGDDTLSGDADSDRFVFEDWLGNDSVLGGSTTSGSGVDFDLLDFSNVTTGGLVGTFSGWEDGTVTLSGYTVTFDNIEGIVATDLADNIDASLDGSGIYLEMGGGDDTVGGGSGDDTLSGGAGDDTIWGAAGADLITGGDGSDTLSGAAGDDTLWGGAGAGELQGGDDADTFIVTSTDGAMSIFGGEGGTDWDIVQLSGGAVSVTWTGWETGTFTYDGVTTHQFWEIEEFVGTSYADSFDASGSTSTAGVVVDAGAGANTIIGSDYGDALTTGDDADSIDGGGGDDTITAGDGADYITGGTGADLIHADYGLDTVHGGDDNDTIYGEGYNDTLYGEAGDDYLIGGSGNDVLYGGIGNDTLEAESGSDVMDGGDGDDSIIGSTTNGGDTIYGGDGADTIAAGIGNNLIEGGTGDDLIGTGGGADTIVFHDGSGADTVTDFDMTDDGTGRTTDQFDVSAMTDAVGDPLRSWDVTVTNDGSDNTLLTFANGETVLLLGVDPATIATTSDLYSMGIPCFVEGTLIDTPEGPRAVEDLGPGDLVRIRDGPPLPIAWAGYRQVSHQEMLADQRLCPVELRPGAFGNARPLRLSAQHCILVPEGPQGALVRARHLALAGCVGVRIMRGKRGCRYHHLLLPRHALILAEGVWVESFWPGPFGFAALGPEARRELLESQPHLAPALLGQVPVDQVYSPLARPILRRRSVTRAACNRWSGQRQADHQARAGLPVGTAPPARSPRAHGTDRPGRPS